MAAQEEDESLGEETINQDRSTRTTQTIQIDTTMSSINIDGVDIQLNSTASTTLQGSMVIMKKQERKNLSSEKRLELFQNITRKNQQSKFKFMSLSISDVEDLQSTYDLQQNLQTLETNFRKYDLLDVFMIVFPINNNSPDLKTEFNNSGGMRVMKVSLLDNYSSLTIEEVAKSSMWYSMWPTQTSSPWYKENLSLSFCNVQSTK